MNEHIFTNARLVLPDGIVEGSLRVVDGRIAEIGAATVAGCDMEGDLLMPGLVELHTDHLENHYGPRPGVRWNMTSAIQAHDAQIASSGITTVFDCLRVGTDEGMGGDDFEPGEMRAVADALAQAAREGRLRSDHLIHVRCEVSSGNAVEQFEAFADMPMVRLASLMDHAPGQRQFQTMDQYVLYYQKKKGLSDAAFQRFCDRRIAQSARHADPSRRAIAERCHARGIAIASHDDATLAHVEDAKREGVRLAEFPTSVEAAKASHEGGMSVLMGAPNVVRGGSHSGNIAAHDLATLGILDVMSSDYVPLSLIHAPFVLAERGLPLHLALAMVTATPARAVGLDDRGRLEPGLRADLTRVRHTGGASEMPVVRSVWREGRRVS